MQGIKHLIKFSAGEEKTRLELEVCIHPTKRRLCVKKCLMLSAHQKLQWLNNCLLRQYNFSTQIKKSFNSLLNYWMLQSLDWSLHEPLKVRINKQQVTEGNRKVKSFEKWQAVALILHLLFSDVKFQMPFHLRVHHEVHQTLKSIQHIGQIIEL